MRPGWRCQFYPPTAMGRTKATLISASKSRQVGLHFARFKKCGSKVQRSPASLPSAMTVFERAAHGADEVIPLLRVPGAHPAHVTALVHERAVTGGTPERRRRRRRVRGCKPKVRFRDCL